MSSNKVVHFRSVRQLQSHWHDAHGWKKHLKLLIFTAPGHFVGKVFWQSCFTCAFICYIFGVLRSCMSERSHKKATSNFSQGSIHPLICSNKINGVLTALFLPADNSWWTGKQSKCFLAVSLPSGWDCQGSSTVQTFGFDQPACDHFSQCQ